MAVKHISTGPLVSKNVPAYTHAVMAYRKVFWKGFSTDWCHHQNIALTRFWPFIEYFVTLLVRCKHGYGLGVRCHHMFTLAHIMTYILVRCRDLAHCLPALGCIALRTFSMCSLYTCWSIVENTIDCYTSTHDLYFRIWSVMTLFEVVIIVTFIDFLKRCLRKETCLDRPEPREMNDVWYIRNAFV